MTLSRILKLTLSAVALGLASYAVYTFAPGQKNSNKENTGTVTRRDLSLKVTIAGGVVPRRMALITPPYNGYIKRLFVHVGDEIKSGSPVVSIAQTVGSAEEEVFPLRSPITGVVVQVARDEGEYVTATASNTSSAAIVRIDDLTKLFVEANVPEIDISKLKVGQSVVIRSVAIPNRTYDGKILEIARAASEQDRWERAKVEFPIRAEITNPDGEIRSGMSAVLDVVVQEAKGALTLGHEFVQKEGKQHFVTMSDGSRRDIEVGMRTADAFEISSGLSEGESVKPVDFLKISGGDQKGAGKMPH
jgi:multidrug efflux pump subunit AcrA (membrane-fusion protein)